MNHAFPLLFLVLFCGGRTPVVAQEPVPAPPAAAPDRGDFASRLQDIAAQLDLSDEQRAKIRPILEQEAADLRVLQADSGLEPGRKLRRFRSINQRASDRVRVLLTPDQQKKYDELRAALRAEMRRRARERRAAAGT